MAKKKQTYTSGDVARMLGIHPRTVRMYLARGKLDGEQNLVTGTWTVDHESLVAFLAKQNLTPEQFAISRRILIVDDDEAVARSIRRVLESSPNGYRIETSEDGYQALIRIGKELPDLIILDSRMPNMDGRQVLQAIRAEIESRQLRVLLVTGYPSDAERLLTLGADDVVLKPFEPAELLRKVEILLSGTSKVAASALA